ncbi:hypothetical protein B0H14DRAFT_3157774 [Mycena olivaceomarginata]|nr:hypothetical protein B0H14DRAFT_3157774 [Mycena olivaceomarginata]
MLVAGVKAKPETPNASSHHHVVGSPLSQAATPRSDTPPFLSWRDRRQGLHGLPHRVHRRRNRFSENRRPLCTSRIHAFNLTILSAARAAAEEFWERKERIGFERGGGWEWQMAEPCELTADEIELQALNGTGYFTLALPFSLSSGTPPPCQTRTSGSCAVPRWIGTGTRNCVRAWVQFTRSRGWRGTPVWTRPSVGGLYFSGGSTCRRLKSVPSCNPQNILLHERAPAPHRGDGHLLPLRAPGSPRPRPTSIALYATAALEVEEKDFKESRVAHALRTEHPLALVAPFSNQRVIIEVSLHEQVVLAAGYDAP